MGGSLFTNKVTDKTIILPSSPSGNGENGQYRLTVMVPKRRYLSYLRERWWLVLVCLAVAVGGTIFYETVRPDSYNSYAQLYVTEGPELASTMFGQVKDDFATEIELLKGQHLRAAAMEDLGPDASQLKKPIELEVVRPMATTILQLRATGPDPALTQHFLQALIDEYLAFKRQTRLSTSDDMVKSLTLELSKHETNLVSEQHQWAEFQQTNNVALLEAESQSAGSFLANENMELANLNLKRELLERGLPPEIIPVISTNTVSTNLNGVAQSEINGNAGTSSSTDEDIENTWLALVLKQAQLAQALTNGPQYLVKPLKDQISQLQENLSALNKAELRDTEQRITAISNAIPQWQTTIADNNDRLAEGEQLRGDIQRQQGYYDSLLGLLQNVDLTKNMEQERVTVLDAPTPGQLLQSSLPMDIFLATALALAASLGIVFVWHLFDDRFVSVRDIKDQFGEVVLGLVPQIKIPRSEPKAALLGESDPRRPYWESYRHLRSALLFSEMGETKPQTILFTGAMSGEGKTTVAMNLARILARSGLRVILVDVDPHGGGLHPFFGKSGRPGLLDCLRGEANTKDIIEQSEIPGLDYIGAGTHREQSEGLLLRPQMAVILEELRKKYDYIILDSAPILAADDAALLVPHAQAVVLVVRPFYSRARMVRQALEMLYQRQAKSVAIVFNQARQDDVAGQRHYSRNGVERAAKPEAVSAR